MRTARTMVVLLGLVAAACWSPASAAAATSRSRTRAAVVHPAPLQAEVQVLVDEINRHRVEIGCSALLPDRRLAAVALRHSEDMVRRQFFDHTNPDGRDPFQRMQAAGIHYRAAAENIARGQKRGAAAFEDWMESPGHRHNIENCRYTHYGIGLYQNNWTLDLVSYGRE